MNTYSYKCWVVYWCYVDLDCDVMFILMLCSGLRSTPNLLACTRLEGLRCTYWLMRLILLRDFNGARFTEATSSYFKPLAMYTTWGTPMHLLVLDMRLILLRGFGTLQTSWHAHDLEGFRWTYWWLTSSRQVGHVRPSWVMLVREDQWGSRVGGCLR